MCASQVEVSRQTEEKVPNTLTQAGGGVFRRMVLVKAQMSEHVEIFNTEFIIRFHDRETVGVGGIIFYGVADFYTASHLHFNSAFFLFVTLKSINPESKAQ